MDTHNVTGRWSGQYSYSRLHAPVAFTANLVETGGWITGTTEEIDRIEADARVLTATLQGKREGLHVQFLKLYDRALRSYDAVAYEGDMSADGKEIRGRWSIPGDWSGTFVMVRQREPATAIERQVAEKV